MNVAAYFRQESSLDDKKKVIVTSLPPIYLQHQGMTTFSLLFLRIIGMNP